MMQGFLHEEGSIGMFLLVTIVLGGGGAALAGRAIALTWRPWWQIVAYMLLLAWAVRFIHYALFGGTLLSLHYYVVDAVVCLGLGFIGFRTARVGQMLTQYRWINQPNGPLRWRRKAP